MKTAPKGAKRLVRRGTVRVPGLPGSSQLPPADWIDLDYAKRQLELRRCRQAWVSWLRTFDWHHYVTLTFRWSVPADMAEAYFRRWARRVEQRAQCRLDWFLILEYSCAGAVHIHALVGNTDVLRPHELAAAWHWGWTRIVRYDPRRGAASYVSKHLTKPGFHYDISPRLGKVGGH